MNLPNDKHLVTEENGFVKTKALDIMRSFIRGEVYLKNIGDTVTSFEKENQKVTEDCVVLFDDIDMTSGRFTGYPASLKAFSKYEILNESPLFGVAVKKDSTVYLSKQMDEPFSAVVWNGDVLSGKVGDYLVANVEANDFRVIDKDVFQKSYKQEI